MMRIFTCVIFALFSFYHLNAQDSIRARIIFIGDAGEMDPEQKMVIPHAAGKVIPGKSTVIYLGDNIYPHGMGLPGTDDEKKGQEILRSQYEPMRAAGAPVYFVPGNHDWDKMGPDGLAKIKQQSAFLAAQNDSLLKLLPSNGCPDPVALDIGDSSVVIFMDSEWWLFPFNKENKDAECNCTSERDILLSLRELFYKNRYKTIFLATHHPFESYGTHGGKFALKDHLFPLTAVSEHLYIPLPVIGSLYPLYRRTFSHPEDLHHPLYKNMIQKVDDVFKDFPNLIHVSGHEHGLQLIEDKENNFFQIVSGGGAKENNTIKGKNSLYGKATQGYVVADMMENGRVHFSFYEYNQGNITEAFNYDWTAGPFDKFEKITFESIPTDSVTTAVHPAYEHNSSFYNFFFGANFRKEWSIPVKLPVLRVSALGDNLQPTKLGGGYQSTSLRLADSASGKEYTLRTVEKSTELILPLSLRGTFVTDLFDDATSAQHPYSALIVKPVADAVKVPTAHPIIGIVAPDKKLGMYQKLFENKVSLFEEREPLGDSKSYVKFAEDLQEDNDNSYDAHNFLMARMIDVLFADWDRHADQWRFYNKNPKGKDKYYIAIPRDRDMVLNVTEGIFPFLAKRLFVTPRVYGFKGNILPGSRHYFFKSSFLNAHPASQLSFEAYREAAALFQKEVTDSVLEASLSHFPPEIYALQHDRLLKDLKERRDGMDEAVESYYKFSNQIVDIHVSDKNEFVLIEDAPEENGTAITIRKINKEGALKDTLMHKIFPRKITREVRIYLGKGDDSVIVNNQSSKVRLRLIGGKGSKNYHVIQSRKTIKVYDRKPEHYAGNTHKLSRHISVDSLNTAFTPVNLYNTALPLLTASLNPDDGLSAGAGMRFVRQKGFRKWPYSSAHQFMVSHSFTTEAFNVTYFGEWMKVAGNADIIVDLDAKAPDNTQNFFGRGNETPFYKFDGYQKYHRTRFNLIDFNPAFRWRGNKYGTFSIGPALEYYHFPKDDNEGRFINHTNEIHSYDSATIQSDKMHVGFVANYTFDNRNNKVLATWGAYFNVKIEGYEGVNKYSKSFVKITPELALYKGLNARQTIVFADRIGGGITLGSTTFYQSMFLGGQGNLFGYRQYRFAGQHSLYNNMELRVLFPDFGNYILKGQFGVAAFYDVGRVWQKGENSSKWHNGVGGGIFITPAGLAVFRFNVAYSGEGWYPSVAMGFRF